MLTALVMLRQPAAAGRVCQWPRGPLSWLVLGCLPERYYYQSKIRPLVSIRILGMMRATFLTLCSPHWRGPRGRRAIGGRRTSSCCGFCRWARRSRCSWCCGRSCSTATATAAGSPTAACSCAIRSSISPCSRWGRTTICRTTCFRRSRITGSKRCTRPCSSTPSTATRPRSSKATSGRKSGRRRIQRWSTCSGPAYAPREFRDVYIDNSRAGRPVIVTDRERERNPRRGCPRSGASPPGSPRGQLVAHREDCEIRRSDVA